MGFPLGRFLFGALLALVVSGAAPFAAAWAQPVNTGHIQAELVAAAQGIAPGQTIHVALRQKIQKDWHTYWRNAGDSGEATKLTWTLPPGWIASDFTWPTPHRLPVGPLVNYGYEGEVLLPVALTAPASAKVGETVTLTGKAAFLVCADICVPEDAVLKLQLPVTAAPAPADPQWGGKITQTLADAPKPAGLAAAFEKQGEVVKLAITGPALKGADLGGAYFYPFSGTVIDHAKPQPIDRGPDGLTLTLTSGYDFQSPTPPKALAGVIALAGKAYEVTAAPGPIPPGAGGLGPPPVKAVVPAGAANLGLASAAFFAFVGGLILNLMPCVFPVLAMKAASLAGHGGYESVARRQGLAFGAGVLATFLGLAALLIALRAAGNQLGWGFQLQDPPVVAALALLMLAVALNLSGVFEVGTSLQGVGSGLASGGGLAGSFFTGVLAVVVAAPCTAPFMGPAVGWALTQPPIAALVVFLGLAIGFALPFVAVAFAPGLLARLPRPGAWMETFKKALAFPMYATVAWLVWVLTVQVGSDAVPRILGAGIVLAAAAWIVGAAQKRAVMGGRPVALVSLAAILAVAAVAGGAFWPQYTLAATPDAAGADAAHLDYEPYTPERLAALRAEGRPVLVNYTAAWCVSCQVNDRVALSTTSVRDALKRDNAVYLKADWTKRDSAIAAELASFGRAGVPLYLVYGAKGGEPVILPSILTTGVVVKALDAAAKPS